MFLCISHSFSTCIQTKMYPLLYIHQKATATISFDIWLRLNSAILLAEKKKLYWLKLSSNDMDLSHWNMSRLLIGQRTNLWKMILNYLLIHCWWKYIDKRWWNVCFLFLFISSLITAIVQPPPPPPPALLALAHCFMPFWLKLLFFWV